MQTNLAHESVRVESGGGGGVEERDEGATLLGKDLDALDWAEADLTEQLVDRGVRRKVANVDSPSLSSAEAS